MNFRGHHKRKVTTVGVYALAKKRNINQVSREAWFLAVAGDDVNGGLKDRQNLSIEPPWLNVWCRSMLTLSSPTSVVLQMRMPRLQFQPMELP